LTSSSLDVQSLGDVENVQVGLRQGPDRFTPVSLDAAHEAAVDPKAARTPSTTLAIRLGPAVHVSRGANLDVHLEGQPTVTFAGTASVSGQIRLPSGSIDVQGKPFEIEKGTITFVGADPSNPQVVLTAGWTAPDSTRVYADLLGPLKTAQLRLRSSPARPQSEIVALILYGTSDQTSLGSPNASGQGGDNAAANTANQAAPFANAATQPLNQAMGRLLRTWGLGGITTKIDQSQVVARPEVEIQIARNLSLQVAWVLGAPPPGTNPDSTLVTLDWNFLRQWSLETTVGDTGTSIFNMVWQQRY
jgi:translocation and assembly module TamB